MEAIFAAPALRLELEREAVLPGACDEEFDDGVGRAFVFLATNWELVWPVCDADFESEFGSDPVDSEFESEVEFEPSPSDFEPSFVDESFDFAEDFFVGVTPGMLIFPVKARPKTAPMMMTGKIKRRAFGFIVAFSARNQQECSERT